MIALVRSMPISILSTMAVPIIPRSAKNTKPSQINSARPIAAEELFASTAMSVPTLRLIMANRKANRTMDTYELISAVPPITTMTNPLAPNPSRSVANIDKLKPAYLPKIASVMEMGCDSK